MEAARRERRLKNWYRKWKLNTIAEFHPTYRDLYDETCRWLDPADKPRDD